MCPLIALLLACRHAPPPLPVELFAPAAPPPAAGAADSAIPGLSVQAMRLVGRWEGSDDAGDHGGFVFRPDGTATVVAGDQRIGEPDDPLALVSWELDPTVVPWQLDLVVAARTSRSELARILCIVELLDDDHLRMRAFIGDDAPSVERPTDFSDSTDTVQLERVRPP